MTRGVILTVHIAAGVIGLLVGPFALAQALRARRPTRLGATYHAAVLVVCLTAVGLTLYDWSGLWFFVPISVASYLFVLWGRRAAASGGDRWYRGVLRGYGGAWIALWTAVLVVSANEWPVTWLIPTVLGGAVIEWLCVRPRPEWVAA